jgi:hypothetical protein
MTNDLFLKRWFVIGKRNITYSMYIICNKAQNILCLQMFDSESMDIETTYAIDTAFLALDFKERILIYRLSIAMEYVKKHGYRRYIRKF